jgi:hypothetical protein
MGYVMDCITRTREIETERKGLPLSAGAMRGERGLEWRRIRHPTSTSRQPWISMCGPRSSSCTALHCSRPRAQVRLKIATSFRPRGRWQTGMQDLDLGSMAIVRDRDLT